MTETKYKINHPYYINFYNILNKKYCDNIHHALHDYKIFCQEMGIYKIPNDIDKKQVIPKDLEFVKYQIISYCEKYDLEIEDKVNTFVNIYLYINHIAWIEFMCNSLTRIFNSQNNL